MPPPNKSSPSNRKMVVRSWSLLINFVIRPWLLFCGIRCIWRNRPNWTKQESLMVAPQKVLMEHSCQPPSLGNSGRLRLLLQQLVVRSPLFLFLFWCYLISSKPSLHFCHFFKHISKLSLQRLRRRIDLNPTLNRASFWKYRDTKFQP